MAHHQRAPLSLVCWSPSLPPHEVRWEGMLLAEHKFPERSRCLFTVSGSLSLGGLLSTRGRRAAGRAQVTCICMKRVSQCSSLCWNETRIRIRERQELQSHLLVLVVLWGHKTQGQVFRRSNSSKYPLDHSRFAIYLLLSVLFLQQLDCWRVGTEEFESTAITCVSNPWVIPRGFTCLTKGPQNITKPFDIYSENIFGPLLPQGLSRAQEEVYLN